MWVNSVSADHGRFLKWTGVESGYWDLNYVIPMVRVRAIMEGKNRKGPVIIVR